jgi:prevent-host-death family protein
MVMKKKRGTPVVREPEAAGEFPVSFSRAISAGEFKAQCLALMEEVRTHGGEYVITKRGTPVARLVPVVEERTPLFGSMKGTVTVRGDIVGPLDEPWDALK